MKISEVCRKRVISRIKYDTPVLVPSFSSRGFENIADIHGKLSEHTTDASLVSAFDLHYSHLSPGDVYSSEVLFIDSGGFETGRTTDLSDLYSSCRSEKEWNEELYSQTVMSLQPLCRIVVVNYDSYGNVRDQVERAKKCFDALPDQYARDFLIKPVCPEDEYLDFEHIKNHVRYMSDFDIIGVTEKELGASYLERCTNLLRLREQLTSVGLPDTPVHVFGSLDPLSVLAYFLCGADIFDGLSWLRLAYQDGKALYLNSYALVRGQWHRPNSSVFARASLENLEQLSRTQTLMARFARTHDWSVLELDEKTLKELKTLVAAAGVEY